MWLLDTTTYQLVPSINPPESYVILSHTWEMEEVTFQDMKYIKAARKKKGWAKIQYTCEEARKGGYMYAWVDTCCIDKSSSAELSESLNSMFNWYKQASVCYVFLSDYESPGLGQSVYDSLSRCRWFTRGWTLQELLAPSSNIFFDADWQLIGCKGELDHALEKITGIERRYLEGQSFRSVPVAKRMSWASGRKTTRIEDTAYCLLGIFDINMPLLYGEGDNAFIRLQHEIANEYPDLSLFAWRQQPGGVRHRGILAESPAEFADNRSLCVRKGVFQAKPEFQLTNRGLRIAVHNIRVWNEISGLLALDLECFGKGMPTDGVSYGVLIRKFGDIYVRHNPDGFVHLSELTSSWSGDPVCIAKAITLSDASYIDACLDTECSVVYDGLVKNIPPLWSVEFDHEGSNVGAVHFARNGSNSTSFFMAAGRTEPIWWDLLTLNMGSMTERFAVVCGYQPAAKGKLELWCGLFRYFDPNRREFCPIVEMAFVGGPGGLSLHERSASIHALIQTKYGDGSGDRVEQNKLPAVHWLHNPATNTACDRVSLMSKAVPRPGAEAVDFCIDVTYSDPKLALLHMAKF